RVREAEHSLSHRQPPRAIAESGDHSRQLLPGNRWRPVTALTIGPRRGPRQLIPGEPRRVDLNDDVVYPRLGLGPLHQLHPGRPGSLVRHNDRLHVNYLLGFSPTTLQRWKTRSTSDARRHGVISESERRTAPRQWST